MGSTQCTVDIIIRDPALASFSVPQAGPAAHPPAHSEQQGKVYTPQPDSESVPKLLQAPQKTPCCPLWARVDHLHLVQLPSEGWASSWVTQHHEKGLVRGEPWQEAEHCTACKPCFSRAALGLLPPITPGFGANQKQGQDGLAGLQLDWVTWHQIRHRAGCHQRARSCKYTRPGQAINATGERQVSATLKGNSSLRL